MEGRAGAVRAAFSSPPLHLAISPLRLATHIPPATSPLRLVRPLPVQVFNFNFKCNFPPAGTTALSTTTKAASPRSRLPQTHVSASWSRCSARAASPKTARPVSQPPPAARWTPPPPPHATRAAVAALVTPSRARPSALAHRRRVVAYHTTARGCTSDRTRRGVSSN